MTGRTRNAQPTTRSKKATVSTKSAKTTKSTGKPATRSTARKTSAAKTATKTTTAARVRSALHSHLRSRDPRLDAARLSSSRRAHDSIASNAR